MIGRVEKRVDLCDGHSLVRLSHLHDFVTCANLARLQDAEVEPRPSAGCEQCRHPRLVHPNANAIAGNARLSDLEQCAADLIAVADANGIVGQSFDREVLAELSVDEVGPLQPLLPVAIRFDLVDKRGSLLTPVAGQVALAVSVQVQPADPTAATHTLDDRQGQQSVRGKQRANDDGGDDPIPESEPKRRAEHLWHKGRDDTEIDAAALCLPKQGELDFKPRGEHEQQPAEIAKELHDRVIYRSNVKNVWPYQDTEGQEPD